tara:strand:+ start:252 stop:713 length:462 start_codon:yes stop_codon:yes gene_type:complete
MMKYLILITALGVVSPVAAETVKAQIEDRYTNISVSEPYTSQDCVMVNVPVYGNVTTQGDAAGGALLGMLLGGLIGKGVTGDDGGAAAGAVFGGIIGADKGSQSKTTQQVTGYTQERQCTEVTHYKSVIKTVYDYSVITWNQNGVVYSETFTK